LGPAPEVACPFPSPGFFFFQRAWLSPWYFFPPSPNGGKTCPCPFLELIYAGRRIWVWQYPAFPARPRVRAFRRKSCFCNLSPNFSTPLLRSIVSPPLCAHANLTCLLICVIPPHDGRLKCWLQRQEWIRPRRSTPLFFFFTPFFPPPQLVRSFIFRSLWSRPLFRFYLPT